MRRPGSYNGDMESLLEHVTEQVRCVEVFEELLESAFLHGQIDGERQTLAYLWLATNPQVLQ